MQGIGILTIPFLGLRKDFRRPTSFQQFLLITQVKSYINCEDPRGETAATSLSKWHWYMQRQKLRQELSCKSVIEVLAFDSAHKKDV